MQIRARRELERGGPRESLCRMLRMISQGCGLREIRRERRVRRVGNEKQTCCMHDGLLDLPRKSRKRIVQKDGGGEKRRNETGTRNPDGEAYAPRWPFHGKDPAPWLSETQPPRDYLNCFVKWINGARRWSRSLLPSPVPFPSSRHATVRVYVFV